MSGWLFGQRPQQSGKRDRSVQPSAQRMLEPVRAVRSATLPMRRSANGAGDGDAHAFPG